MLLINKSIETVRRQMKTKHKPNSFQTELCFEHRSIGKNEFIFTHSTL